MVVVSRLKALGLSFIVVFLYTICILETLTSGQCVGILARNINVKAHTTIHLSYTHNCSAKKVCFTAVILSRNHLITPQRNYLKNMGNVNKNIFNLTFKSCIG